MTGPRATGWLKILLSLAVLLNMAGMAIFLLVLAYAWRNTSGHTAVDLATLHAVFLPFALSGAGLLLLVPDFASRPGGRFCSLWMCLTGGLGSLSLVLLPAWQVLLPYEHWLKAGQPDRSAQAVPLLAALGGGYLLLFLLILARLVLAGPGMTPAGSAVVPESSAAA